VKVIISFTKLFLTPILEKLRFKTEGGHNPGMVKGVSNTQEIFKAMLQITENKDESDNVRIEAYSTLKSIAKYIDYI